jgi:hypothetical protein
VRAEELAVIRRAMRARVPGPGPTAELARGYAFLKDAE